MKRVIGRREYLVFALLALLAAIPIVRLVNAPNYTDAFYHFNAANRLAAGDGLTDTYLWTYLGAPDRLPESGVFPSHLYWMPLTSVIAGVSMALFNAPGNHAIAQLPFIPMLAGVALIGFWLGARLVGTRRGAWLAGLVSLCNGFFIRYWGAIETFAPYAIFGAGALVLGGLALERFITRRPMRGTLVLCFGAGMVSGLGHLTRNDGILLVGVIGLLIGIAGLRQRRIGGLLTAGLTVAVGYVLVMLPLFIRNVEAVGSPLPFGGTQAIWFTEYNELFNFPPDANPDRLLAFGVWATRQDSIVNNLLTFIAVEGLVILTPFMLIGLWRQRRDPVIAVFGVYALLLHLVMTLVFPFPGYRGGLFHSAAALIPFWAALGIAGLDSTIEAVARRRRRWRAGQAKTIFGAAVLGTAALLSVNIAMRGAVPPTTPETTPPLYPWLSANLPADARLLINDPAGLYYFTGLGGAVLPNEAPDVIPTIAERYRITHVLIELDAAGNPLTPLPLVGLVAAPPPFLDPIPLPEFPLVRLYAIQSRTSTP